MSQSCRLFSMGPTHSIPSPPGSMWECWKEGYFQPFLPARQNIILPPFAYLFTISQWRDIWVDYTVLYCSGCCYAICTLRCLVSPKVSVWARTNGHMLPLLYTTYLNCMVRNLVSRVWMNNFMALRKSDAHAHSQPWKRRTQQPSHTHISNWGGA